VACASSSTSSRPPLSDRVDVATVASLATFSAADRICRPVPSEVFRRQEFRRCMHARQDLTACDTTAEDLVQLQALMREDTRLSAVASFESVVNHIASQCDADWRVRAESGRELALPRECVATMPVLLAHAVTLRIPPNGGDANALAHQACAGTDGKLFLIEQCFEWGSPRGRSVATVERLRPKYLEYFCPLKIREWPDP
jgi:hypothetical protein